MTDQVEETVENQAEAVQDQVAETVDAKEELGKLLHPEVQEPIQESQEVIQEVKEEVQTKEVGIIDDEMIQQFPTLKMYRGKSLLDIPKAYHNLTLAYAEDHRRLKQIEKEQAKKLPDISTIPDPVEKPEEHRKWLEDYTEKVRKEALSEVPQPQVNWVAKVQEVLPKDADVQKVIDSWDKYNAERLYDEMGNLRPEIQSFYNSHPQILINEIRGHYALSSQAEKNSMTIQQEANNKAYKTVTNSIKKSNENRDELVKANFNQVNRTNVGTPEEDLLALIYKKAQGK